tara:strand:+ start:1444 stop:1869 length:426 start_codon:yes stop_codon:yes gene_type:complete
MSPDAPDVIASAVMPTKLVEVRFVTVSPVYPNTKYPPILLDDLNIPTKLPFVSDCCDKAGQFRRLLVESNTVAVLNVMDVPDIDPTTPVGYPVVLLYITLNVLGDALLLELEMFDTAVLEKAALVPALSVEPLSVIIKEYP